MADDPHRDTSELNAPLKRLHDLHDCLQCDLDPFVNGRTRKLAGARKRDRLHGLLYEMGAELRLIERLRSKELPLLKRHVTTTMKQSILYLKQDVVVLRRELIPVNHCLGKESQSVQYRLKRLHDQLGHLVFEVFCDPDNPEMTEAIKDACWDLEMGDDSAFEPIIKRLTASER